MSVNITNLQLELKSLENEGDLLYKTYQEKWQEYKNLNPMMEGDVKQMKEDFHNIMDGQFKLTSGTFALVGCAIDELERMKVTVYDLSDEKEKIQFLRSYRDWLGRFFHKLKAKLGNNKWKKVKEAIYDYRYDKIDVSKRECVISLNKLLNNISMSFEDIVILFEMKGGGNDTFHQRWEKADEFREHLKDQQFPAGMEKYKDPLLNLANASNSWIAWR